MARNPVVQALGLVLASAGIVMMVGSMPSCGSARRAAEEAKEVLDVQARPEAITMAEYEAIQPGMTYADVVAIVGSEGTQMAMSQVLEVTTEMWMWEGEFLGANANVTFQNGIVTAKAQLGLT